MSWILWIALALVLVVLVGRLLSPGIDRSVARAMKAQDVGELLQEIGRKAAGVRPTVFNHAIRKLWDNYQRSLALPLIRELGRTHSVLPIAQYWIHQALTVEPALARTALDQAFLDSHYQPELAARCGSAG